MTRRALLVGRRLTGHLILLAAAFAVIASVSWLRVTHEPAPFDSAPFDFAQGRQAGEAVPHHSPEVGAGLSRLTTSRDDLERTISVARERLNADARDAAAAVALAEALIRQARVLTDGSLALEAERVLERVLRHEPSHYEATRLLGTVYLSQHRFRDAVGAAKRARDMRPRDAYNYGVLGDAWLELGEYDLAFEAFDEMTRLRPGAAAYARVAYAHELQGRLDEALRHMRMAAEATSAHDPESLSWHYAQLGNLYLQQGDLELASREFARSHHACPNHPYARTGLARVAAARGEVARALELYRELLEEAPTPELAAVLGDLLQTTGDAARAHEMYARAETLEREGWKNEAPQPAALARMLAERGLKVDEAVKLAEQAAEERSDIFTMDALALAYLRAGRLEAARAASVKARRTGTVDARIVAHAAEIDRALAQRSSVDHTDGPQRRGDAETR